MVFTCVNLVLGLVNSESGCEEVDIHRYQPVSFVLSMMYHSFAFFNKFYLPIKNSVSVVSNREIHSPSCYFCSSLEPHGARDVKFPFRAPKLSHLGNSEAVWNQDNCVAECFEPPNQCGGREG